MKYCTFNFSATSCFSAFRAKTTESKGIRWRFSQFVVSSWMPLYQNLSVIMWTTLSIVLGWAVANSWLEKNPVKGIKLPRTYGGRRVARTALTRVQLDLLLSKLEQPIDTLVLLLWTTGLRISECAGLRWSDLKDGVLQVRQRVYAGEVGEVKSAKALRDLPLPDEILGRLRSLPQNGEYIFPARNGQPLNPKNWLRRYVRPAEAKAGLRLRGWHDFRHSTSTRLRKDGIHPRVVSAILGHSRVQLALDVYDHCDLGDLQHALKAVQLNPNEPKTEAAA